MDTDTCVRTNGKGHMGKVTWAWVRVNGKGHMNKGMLARGHGKGHMMDKGICEGAHG